MLETTATVQAILESSMQMQSAMMGLVADMRAQAWQALWNTAPMWIRVLLAVSLTVSTLERAYRVYRRWRRALL